MKLKHHISFLLNFGKFSPVIQSILSPFGQKTAAQQSSRKSYTEMQKGFYEDAAHTPEDIVGHYEWHENFPYETFLLYHYGDVRFPLFESYEGKRALDFGCGPGRMVRRMRKFFSQVDGCDISRRLLDVAAEINPGSSFYHTSGDDLGGAPEDHYDFIYCTISMQHIASHTIRMAILEKMSRCLKKGGKITLQMAYAPDAPYTIRKNHEILGKRVYVLARGNQAGWRADDYHAAITNGAHDAAIGRDDLPAVKEDVSKWFSGVEFWFANTREHYADLKGTHHHDYWADSWIFIHGTKR